MAKVIDSKLRDGEHSAYLINCPACGSIHRFDNRWSFNGDFEKLTFKPSMLLKSGHYMRGHKGDCWCDYNKKHPAQQAPQCTICHSFVTDGKIKYLSDCTHEFAGKTLDLEDMEVNGSKI